MINFLAGILLLPLWLIATSHDAPQPDLEMGKRIYQERCKVCHGSKGDGKSFAANALNPPPKNFTSEQSKKQLTLKRMIDSATNGRPRTAMMPWKDVLTAEEIRAVVHYIRKELMRVSGLG
jgi:mono/diheme cytochrome c family protein